MSNSSIKNPNHGRENNSYELLTQWNIGRKVYSIAAQCNDNKNNKEKIMNANISFEVPFDEAETQEEVIESLADTAFWKIDAMVGRLFDEFVVRDNLPAEDEHHGKIECRGFYPLQRDAYDKLYFESVEKACEQVKVDDPLAFQALVDEHGSEEKLVFNFKFN